MSICCRHMPQCGRAGRRQDQAVPFAWSLRRPFHRDDKRLFLVGSAVGHQRSCPTDAVVPREMRNLGRHEGDLTRLQHLRALSFDLDDQTSFDNKQDFLCRRMHVPGGSHARRHFQDIDHRLLDLLVLSLQVIAQDLRELWPALRRPGLTQCLWWQVLLPRPRRAAKSDGERVSWHPPLVLCEGAFVPCNLDAEKSPGAKHRWLFFIRRRGDDIFQDFVNRQALMPHHAWTHVKMAAQPRPSSRRQLPEAMAFGSTSSSNH
jgi:hypothetical protein